MAALLASPAALVREACGRRLSEFVLRAWRVIEPTTPLVWGRHLDAVCEHLEAVSRRQLRNLVVTIPPRSSKSTLVSVLWPAWEWLHRPSARFLTASYALALSVRDALRSRRVLSSPWFRSLWGDRFALSGDQNLKSRYENDKTGFRMAASVEGAVTGEGADYLIVDDPHNVVEAESAAVRQATIRWWDEAFSNRLNDAKRGCRVIVGQRVHTHDLIGHVLAQGGFEELRIPEEFEAAHRSGTSTGWRDWRTQDGELLREERFGREQVEEAKRRLGRVAYAAQHQQRPVPREGALFRAEWLKEYVPTGDGYRIGGRFVPAAACERFTVMDPAGGTSTSADYTAVLTFAVTPANELLVIDAVRRRVPLEGIVPLLLDVCRRERPDWVAAEAGFFQHAIVRQARAAKGMPPVREVTTGGKSKLARAVPAVVKAEAGQLLIPDKAPWRAELVDELLVFTGNDDAHDDQVDCISYATYLMMSGGAADGRPMTLRARGER